MFDRLTVDESRERKSIHRNARREQPTDLVEEPFLELRVHPASHASRRLFGGNPQREGDDLVLGKRRRRIGKVLGERTTGEEIDLERAHEPLAIARLNPLRGWWIDAGEQPVQPLGTSRVGDSIEPRAQRNVAAGTGKETARER